MYERKTLGLLQPTHQGKLTFQGGKLAINSPASKKRKNDENDYAMTPGRKDGIYEDPPTPATKRTKLQCSTADVAVQTVQSIPALATAAVTCTDATTADDAADKVKNDTKNTQDDAAQSVIDMLTSVKPNEKYWEMVASKRKSSLSSALDENRQLHKHNSELQEQVHGLTTENALLEDMIQEARQLAEMVMKTTESQEDNEESLPQQRDGSGKDGENKSTDEPGTAQETNDDEELASKITEEKL